MLLSFSFSLYVSSNCLMRVERVVSMMVEM